MLKQKNQNSRSDAERRWLRRNKGGGGADESEEGEDAHGSKRGEIPTCCDGWLVGGMAAALPW